MTNQEKINKIINTLGNSSDIVKRTVSDNLSYIYLESVSSDDKVSNFLLKSIVNINDTDSLLKYLEENILNSHIQIVNNFDECFYYLASGYTCLFLNNDSNYIVIETKSTLDRGVTESNSEPLIRGPKDSFTENNSTNIGLIRKRIKDSKLRIDEVIVGKRSQSKVSIIYIDDIAENQSVSKTKKIISEINIDGVLDTGYIRDYLVKEQRSTFPKVISTERPDTACQAILMGKIIVMVENSPYVIIFPVVLTDFFKTSEDYYQSNISTSFSRILKIVAFFITIITPALYISLMTFNQEMIPNQLLISLASQRSQVPFPTFIEVLLFIIIFEILREADMKSPSASGSSMSIVGALVLGEASVAAGIVSPIVIIVVAITSICELVFTDMDFINAIRQWRLLFVLFTALTGIIGLVIAGLILLIRLASLESLGVPYLAPYSPLEESLMKDSILLYPTNKRTKRPSFLSKNKTKAGN